MALQLGPAIRRPKINRQSTTIRKVINMFYHLHTCTSEHQLPYPILQTSYIFAMSNCSIKIGIVVKISGIDIGIDNAFPPHDLGLVQKPLLLTPINYTTRKKYGISGKHHRSTRIWYFDLLEMAWHQPLTSIVILMQFSLVMLWTKNAICNVRN